MKRPPAPAQAGYSGTPLPKKLGLKPGQRVHFAGAPAGFVRSLGALPARSKLLRRPAAPLDFIHLFCDSRAELDRKFPALAAALAPVGMLWVSWPKKASGVPTDLTEDRIRAAGLSLGLVDVKVCAVDAVWSGLKFVIPLSRRG